MKLSYNLDELIPVSINKEELDPVHEAGRIQRSIDAVLFWISCNSIDMAKHVYEKCIGSRSEMEKHSMDKFEIKLIENFMLEHNEKRKYYILI